MELIEIIDNNGNFKSNILNNNYDEKLLHKEICVFILNEKKEVLTKNIILINGLC